MYVHKEPELIKKSRIVKNCFERFYVILVCLLWIVATCWDIYKLQSHWFDYALELYTSFLIFITLLFSISPNSIPTSFYRSFKIISTIKGRGCLFIIVSLLFLKDNFAFHRFSAFVLLIAGVLSFICEILIPTTKKEIEKIEDMDDELLKKQTAQKEFKEEENENNNSDKNDDLSNLRNQGWQIADSNNESNEKKEQKSMDDNLSKNEKYANYPKNMLEIINKIRSDPKSYSDIIEDSIKNIIEIEGDDENTPKYIYKKKVKVALARGEPAFTEAAEELKNLNPLPPLELKNEICVALPQKEEEIKDSSYLREQVKILRENTNVDVFFKDLIKIPEVSALLMIVDDSTKSPGKKRQAVLNPNYKYIGISSKFIGKTFVAYFTFSKK